MPNRREFLAALAAPALAATTWRSALIEYLESLRKHRGGYGWEGDADPHLTPTYFVIGCYQVLGSLPPRQHELIEWVRANNPLPPRRHVDRPLRRFWFEQIQSILWLGGDPGSFRPEVARWTAPIEFTKQYELDGNPVFQQEVHALRCRELLKLEPTAPWSEYVMARRRPNGTFNNTPASDGSDGHVMNTLWGLQAQRALGEPPATSAALVGWLQSCQLREGGFTWSPRPTIAGVDDVAYTWAAVKALSMIKARPDNPPAAIAHLQALGDGRGVFRDRAGHKQNPMATFYALEALHLLASEPAIRDVATQPKPKAQPRTADSRLRWFTMQVEAPGKGSPSEAVELARALRIDWWAAKNAAAGWIEAAQKVAVERKVPVRFCTGNEEYGTYVQLRGLGTYSHLADFTAPANTDIGKQMPDIKKPIRWDQFRDQRIRSLLDGQGRMVWQFNENEELTRILLDEAVERGTFAAICTHHFGNENFASTQPFLRRWEGVLPYVALQDAHTQEPWWWGDQLEGFRTMYLAESAQWDGWLAALRNNRMVSIRQDEITNGQLHVLGGRAEDIASASDWWARNRAAMLRPAAVVTIVRPGNPFEKAAPDQGATVRVRTRRSNTTQGMPANPVATFVRLEIDGSPVNATLTEERNPQGRLTDVYHSAKIAAPGMHRVRAVVARSAREETVSVAFELT